MDKIQIHDIVAQNRTNNKGFSKKLIKAFIKIP